MVQYPSIKKYCMGPLGPPKTNLRFGLHCCMYVCKLILLIIHRVKISLYNYGSRVTANENNKQFPIPLTFNFIISVFNKMATEINTLG